MKNVNNHKQLFVQKAGTADYSSTYDGVVFTGDNIPAGTVAVVDRNNKVVADGATVDGDYLWIAQSQGSGLPIIKSAPIRKSTAKVYVKAYAAATEQIDYIGYDGTNSGTGYDLSDFTADEAIIIRASLKSNFYQFTDKELHVIGDCTPTSADTEATVAKKLAKSLIQNSEKFVNIPFLVERTSDGSQADFTGTATILKVTKGSKTVSAYVKATDATSNFSASTMTAAVGNVFKFPAMNAKSFTFTADALGSGAGRHVIYIGTTPYNVADAGSGAQNATAIAAAINAGTQATATVSTADVTIVYKDSTVALPPVAAYTADDSSWSLAAITINTTAAAVVPSKYVAATAVTAGASFELDIAWQGETGYIVGGTADEMCGVMSSVTAWGIKLTGKARRFQEGVFRYELNKWVTSVAGLGATIIGKYAAAFEGSGTYKQIMEEEWFLQLQEGMHGSNLIQVPPVAMRKNAVSGETYDVVEIVWNDTHGDSILSNSTHYNSVRIAHADAYDTSDLEDTLSANLTVA